MSDSGERTPNVESVNQGNRSGSHIELPEIQEELNKTVSSAPNPKKAPLNYIDNMEEWEKSQKKYWREVHEKQRELESILQASEDKQTELDFFRDERTKLGVELQKIEGSLSYKLSSKIDLFNDIANSIKEGAEQQLKKLRITMKWEENGGQQIVKLISDRELSQEEQDMVYEQFVAQMAEQGRDLSDVNVEFECDNGDQSDELQNLGDFEDAESIGGDGFDEEQGDGDIPDEDGNLENMNNLLELSITSRIGTELTEVGESILREYLMKQRENERKKHNYESLKQCVDYNINYYYHKDGYC